MNIRHLSFVVIFIGSLLVWNKLLGLELTDRTFNFFLVSSAVGVLTYREKNK